MHFIIFHCRFKSVHCHVTFMNHYSQTASTFQLTLWVYRLPFICNFISFYSVFTECYRFSLASPEPWTYNVPGKKNYKRKNVTFIFSLIFLNSPQSCIQSRLISSYNNYILYNLWLWSPFHEGCMNYKS